MHRSVDKNELHEKKKTIEIADLLLQQQIVDFFVVVQTKKMWSVGVLSICLSAMSTVKIGGYKKTSIDPHIANTVLSPLHREILDMIGYNGNDDTQILPLDIRSQLVNGYNYAILCNIKNTNVFIRAHDHFGEISLVDATIQPYKDMDDYIKHINE